jgi:hypothetical protein
MAQTSTTLSGQKNHVADITGTDISISTSGSISSTSTVLTGEGKLAVRDLVKFTGAGTNNNDTTFTVKEVVSTTEFTVEETVSQSDNSDGSTTFTLDHVGFVTDKVKGDGYYSQPDGVHTVAYQVLNRDDSTDDFNGTVKMQGSLATTPTEDDWFDISGTTMQSDLSTTIASYNFTGNYVWVRAKTETTNSSGNSAMITSILLNH